jgi:hypothetical protein
VIHHVEVGVEQRLLSREIAFWGALGWRADYQRSRGVKWPGEWLRSGTCSCFVWLRPDLPVATGVVVFCVVLPWDETVKALQRVVEVVKAEQLEPYWGAKHLMLETPSGVLVEVLERRPRANRYGPPWTG